MSCILYHEDKILVTNEDFLPVIEIDETYPSSLYTDYHWLMKVIKHVTLIEVLIGFGKTSKQCENDIFWVFFVFIFGFMV